MKCPMCENLSDKEVCPVCGYVLTADKPEADTDHMETHKETLAKVKADPEVQEYLEGIKEDARGKK